MCLGHAFWIENIQKVNLLFGWDKRRISFSFLSEYLGSSRLKPEIPSSLQEGLMDRLDGARERFPFFIPSMGSCQF